MPIAKTCFTSEGEAVKKPTTAQLAVRACEQRRVVRGSRAYFDGDFGCVAGAQTGAKDEKGLTPLTDWDRTDIRVCHLEHRSGKAVVQRAERLRQYLLLYL